MLKGSGGNREVSIALEDCNRSQIKDGVDVIDVYQDAACFILPNALVFLG